MSSENENIVLFPFMAQGHIIPFLSLALKLEQQTNYAITLINTPLNINRLKQNLPKHSAIRLLEIPFADAETTANLPGPLIRRLVETSVSLRPAFRDLVSRIRPICVISDIFFPWTAEAAREFNSRHAIFFAGGGFGMAGWAATSLNPVGSTESDPGGFFVPGFPKSYVLQSNNLPETPRRPWKYGQEIFHGWKETDVMLFNTMEEFDGIGLNYFRQNFPKCSVFPIGPILNCEARRSPVEGENDTENNHDRCMEWLDSKPKNSVLYVAFGSQNSPSEKQTLELAKALEASNADFLWILRPPSGSIVDLPDKDRFLPTGFVDRVRSSDKGLLVENWAPQMEILAHESVGAFLSHCGWNSTIEALSNGVPMLTWPMGAEQPFNARFLEGEIGACVGVTSGGTSVVKCGEIVEKIELIMKGSDDGEGNVIRRKACEVKEMIREATYDEGGWKGSSVKAMESFVNTFLHTGKVGKGFGT
ncbi:hypothetical protein OROHE_024142 [Orobanche hederae]